MWPLSFPFSPFQHFTRLVNVLSAFPAVYEVLKGKALPTKEQYTFRDIPDTIPVSCLFFASFFCQKGWGGSSYVSWVWQKNCMSWETWLILWFHVSISVTCEAIDIFFLAWCLCSTTLTVHAHITILCIPCIPKCLYSMCTQLSIFHAHPNVFMHTPVVDIQTLAIHACIHIFLHPPPPPRPQYLMCICRIRLMWTQNLCVPYVEVNYTVIFHRVCWIDWWLLTVQRRSTPCSTMNSLIAWDWSKYQCIYHYHFVVLKGLAEIKVQCGH